MFSVQLFFMLSLLQERSELEACHLQQIVGQCHNPKSGVNLLQPSQGEPPKRPVALDVTESCSLHPTYVEHR